MLDIDFIIQHRKLVERAIKSKGLITDIGRLLSLDEERRALIELSDNLRHDKNNLSRSTAHNPVDKNARAEAIKLKKRLAEIDAKLRSVKKEYDALMLSVPNIPWEGAPVGTDSSTNQVIKKVGRVPRFNYQFKDHLTLGHELDLIDFKRGASVSGFRGYYLRNEAVLMQYGLLLLGLERMRAAGFTLMTAPAIVKDFALTGSGYFPFGHKEIFRLSNPDQIGPEQTDNQYLAGTSESPLLAYYANSIIPDHELPIRLCGISPCYREEVGGYGKQSKGLYRVKEFFKVEQVVISRPDQAESDQLFEQMLKPAEGLLHDLGLPYRLVETSTGDMGAGKRRMVDIETWMPSLNTYGETHSCSDLTDWQARRLNIRIDRGGKRAFAFTLNNTVIASPRILIALLENHQQADGSIKIPKVLQMFIGKKCLKPIA